jgi:hypothetical protein
MGGSGASANDTLCLLMVWTFEGLDNHQHSLNKSYEETVAFGCHTQTHEPAHILIVLGATCFSL